MSQNFFTPFDPKASISEAEKKVTQFWKDFDIFNRSIETRSENKVFNFFDGPPFATGLPHYGHILAGTIKDVVPRYWTMRGYRVPRKWGWDCHGVPVEFQVEKEHNLGGKPGIEALGIPEFNGLCRSIVLRCAKDWIETVDRMGRFVDTKNDYRTMDPEFMESVWAIFGMLWDKGLIYEGEKVVAYSPKLGSPLSNFEANLNYKNIDDPALTVKFKLESGAYILAWTTTPWTLPSNVALGFGRDHIYALVEHEGSQYWVAEKAVERYFGEEAIIVETRQGKSFLNESYEPLFPFFEKGERRFVCLHDEGDYVSTDSGTGIVHFAPSFGAEDAELCQSHKVFGINPIDENGYFDEQIPDLKGLYFRADQEVEGSKENNANKWVINALKESEKLFKQDQIHHEYPFCWRTDCALMYRGIKTWFMDVQKIKTRAIELNQNINWKPEHLKDGRFGKILQDAPDWAISRNRYWGTPIPVWKCDKTGAMQVITSRSQLEEACGQSVEDIHTHFVDGLTWENKATGGTMRRIPEVFDCWMESGSMPYASAGFPACVQKVQHNRFGLVRHGESENNIKKIYNTNPEEKDLYPLTPKGRDQADSIKESFDIVVSSPFARARETAEIIAEKNNTKVIIDDRLREIYVKEFDGLEAIDLHEYPADYNFKNGESLVDCTNRAQKCLQEYDQKFKDKRIAFITHGGVIEGLTQWYKHEKVRWRGFDSCPENGQLVWLEPQTVTDFAPADFIAEGLDQTRCWFYVLHILGTALWDKNIFKNVVTNGIVLAEDGQKMSKSKQNYPDPNLIFDKYGADSMRLYLMQSPAVKGENLRFIEAGVEEMLKNIILPLRNTYLFLSTYANIDGWKPTKFVFMRHGESEHNLLRIYSGKVENAHTLTPKGIRQAHDLAQNPHHFDRLISSPMIRTQDTAKIIGDEKKCALQTDDRLTEIDFGPLEGKAYLAPGERLKHKTEPLPSTYGRMESFIKEKAEKHPGETIGVVSHGGVIKAAFAGHLYGNLEVSEYKKCPDTLVGQSQIVFPLPQSTHQLDQWIVSELQTLIENYQTQFEAYHLDQVTKLFSPFIDKLNNWYLRRSRTRFWAQGLDDEKRSAYETLHYVLLNLSKLLAPLAPFLAEQLYQDLVGNPQASVHLEFMPMAHENLIDKALEHQMQMTRDIVGLSAGIRAKNKIKLRQPLQKLKFCGKLTTVDIEIIKAEANVKEVEQIEDLKGVAEIIVKIDASKVGRKFGKKIQSMIGAGKEGRFEILENKRLKVEGEILESDEYEISYLCGEGLYADSTSQVVVLLETEITPELKAEGLARELIRTIQEKRKKEGLEITDRVEIFYHSEVPEIKNTFDGLGDMIQKETLASSIKFQKGGNQYLLDGMEVLLEIKKAS